MLLRLPTELLLLVLKHLPVSSIVACRAASRLFRSFVDQHESTIYRQAASHPSLHLIPHDQILLEDVPLLGWHSKRFLGSLGSWKDLCRRACEVRSSWRGRGRSWIKKYDHISSDVHRIKVDETRGIFIVTRHQGGLAVVQIRGDKLTWDLPRNYVRPYAHCEYGEGFLIFDRYDGSKEVWRLVSYNPRADPPGDFDVVPESLPDAAQLYHSRNSVPSQIRPIKFVAHALLRPPDNVTTRAYRFVYPTLLAAAYDMLLLWDVRTGKLVERINNIQRPLGFNIGPTSAPGEEADHAVTDDDETGFLQAHLSNSEPGDQNENAAPPHHTQEADDEDRLGNIHYVEVNDKYAIVCGLNSLRVFRRERAHVSNDIYGGGNADDRSAGTCVLELTPSHIENHGKWFFRVGYVKQHELPEDFRSWRERRRDEVRGRADAGISRWNEAREKDGNMSVEENSADHGQDEGQTSLGSAASGFSGAVGEDSPITDADWYDEDDSNSDQWSEEGSEPWWWTRKAIVSHDTGFSRAHGTIYTSSEFQAAHVSPCGQHLVTLLENSRLLIIPYYERLITGQVTDVHDIKIDIQLNAPAESRYLAYEDGRIGVVTELAVFIIHPTFPDSSDLCTPPQIEVHRVISLNDPSLLRWVTCLQMTPTALWLNWEIGREETELLYQFERNWQVEHVQAHNIFRRNLIRSEVAHEERFEMTMDTGTFDAQPELERGFENSFVFSVDFGLENLFD